MNSGLHREPTSTERRDSSQSMLHILISDDHAVFRRGIRDILLEYLRPAHIEEAGTGTAMLQLASLQAWDLFVMDITMPGTNGVELLRELLRVSPNTPILIFSMHPEATYAVRMIQAGARGYLNKATSPEKLVTAVQTVLSGSRYISPEVADCLLASLQADQNIARHRTLSHREFETLRLLAAGKSLKSIAAGWGVSVNTISTYRLRLLKKLGISSNAGLARYAMEHCLLD